MKKLIIRKARRKDLAEILEIVNHEILNSTVLYDYEERTYDTQVKWFEQKDVEGMPVLVAENLGVVTGFGTYGNFRPRAAYQFSVEHSIYVHKEHRGSGIGKELMTELIHIAKEDGFHTMIAGVDTANSGSVDFHKKFGFKEVGTFKEVGYKFDKWLDVMFLQLLLK